MVSQTFPCCRYLLASPVITHQSPLRCAAALRLSLTAYTFTFIHFLFSLLPSEAGVGIVTRFKSLNAKQTVHVHTEAHNHIWTSRGADKTTLMSAQTHILTPKITQNIKHKMYQAVHEKQTKQNEKQISKADHRQTSVNTRKEFLKWWMDIKIITELVTATRVKALTGGCV